MQFAFDLLFLCCSCLYAVLTKVRQGAIVAFWCARRAGVSSKLNNPMAEIAAQMHGKKRIHETLHLDGILERLRVHSKPAADADTMGVCNGAALSVKVAKQQICHLASHPGKFEELLHGVRDHAVKVLDKHPAGILDVLRLDMIESAWTNDGFDFGKFSICQILRGWETGK